MRVDTGATGFADSKLKAQNWFDVSATVKLHDQYTLHAGVENVFDRQPPLIGSGELPGTVGNGNTFPQAYDALGRYMFVGITADF